MSQIPAAQSGAAKTRRESLDLLDAVRPVLAAAPAGPIGVAVSGGGDSTALLMVLHQWTQANGRALAAVTIDHGLRLESADEAQAVAHLCAAHAIPHQILRWSGWCGSGNLQNAAREARRSLIARWARIRGIQAVALGHTLDDQAETLLMRLGRGSGVDGLSAMAPRSAAAEVIWLRPLLTVRRKALRDWLVARGINWCEDPTNDNPAFTRVQVRAALRHLEPLGLTPERLAETAFRMARAREALEADAHVLSSSCIRKGFAGDLVLDPARLAAASREVALRVLASALMWVSGASYRPRLARLEAALDTLVGTGLARGATLHGCVLRPVGGGVAIRREPARAAAPVPVAEGVWDGRWELVDKGGEADDLLIGAIGEAGLAAIPRWRETVEVPRETLLTTPAVWRRGGGLVAAPFVTGGKSWRFRHIATGDLPCSQSCD